MKLPTLFDGFRLPHLEDFPARLQSCQAIADQQKV